jgi:two-component system, sporulation sensor kinase E
MNFKEDTKNRQEQLKKKNHVLEEKLKYRTKQLKDVNENFFQESQNRRLIEIELAHSKKILEMFTENMIDIILIMDVDGKLKYISPSQQKIFGYTEEEIVGKKIYGFFHQDDVERMRYLYQFHMHDFTSSTASYRFRKKNGNYIWMESSIKSFVEQEQIFAVVVSRDISERKKAEQDVLLSEKKYRMLFDSCEDALFVQEVKAPKDLLTNFIEVNEVAARRLGYSKEELIKMNPLHINAYSKDELYQIRKNIFKNKKIFYETTHITKDGSLIPCETNGHLFDYQGKTFLYSNVRDITVRKEMEKEMLRLDRLSLIGEMAAGIGHEIRNPMTAVRGFLQLLEKKDECRKFSEFFDIMIDELDRANAIITEYLSLAHNKKIEKQLRNLNEIILSLHPLLRANATSMNIDIILNLTEPIPKLWLDNKEIRQLIVNLIRNACEAMEEGGQIILKTYEVDEEIVLAIEDEGRGIDPKVLDKLGTPFVTTKDTGTGLGLAVCYSIVTRHEARLNVATSEKGTTFYISFKNPLKQGFHGSVSQ